MATAVSGSQSATNLVSQQLRTQQAQRAAEQAEANARALRQQARSAQQNADQAQESARDLKVRSDQAQGHAGSARRVLASMESLGQVETRFNALERGVSSDLAALKAAAQPTAPAAATAPTAPVVNAEGQTTGSVINVTA